MSEERSEAMSSDDTSGVRVIQAGVALIANALFPVVFLVPVLFVIRRYVVDREERYLERKFGEDYLSYRRRVRRWP